MYSVIFTIGIRRACLKDGMSVRAAALYLNKDRKTIVKMLRHELPPGYCCSEEPPHPRLNGYVESIDEILCTDKALIKSIAIQPNGYSRFYETNTNIQAVRRW